MCKHTLTRVDEIRECRIILTITMKARTLVGGGGGGVGKNVISRVGWSTKVCKHIMPPSVWTYLKFSLSLPRNMLEINATETQARRVCRPLPRHSFVSLTPLMEYRKGERGCGAPFPACIRLLYLQHIAADPPIGCSTRVERLPKRSLGDIDRVF